MKKNLLKVLLTLAMVFSLFAGMTVTASAAGEDEPAMMALPSGNHSWRVSANEDNNTLTLYCDKNNNNNYQHSIWCDYGRNESSMKVTLSVVKNTFCIDEYVATGDNKSVKVTVTNGFDDVTYTGPTFYKHNGQDWIESAVNGAGIYKAVIGLRGETVSVEFTIADGHIYDNNCDEVCNRCEYERNDAPHNYSNDCDKKCNSCPETREAEHTYDNSCDTNCNVCSAPRSITHTYDNDCDAICNVCSAPRSITHTYDNDCDAICNVCEDERQAGHDWMYWVYPYNYNVLNVSCRRDDCAYKGMTITITANNHYDCVGEIDDATDGVKVTSNIPNNISIPYTIEYRKVYHNWDEEKVPEIETAGFYKAAIVPEESNVEAFVLFYIENAHVYTNNCDTSCNKCGDPREITHDFTENTTNPDALKTAATCQKKAVYYYTCSVCGVTSEDITDTTFEGSVIPCDFTAMVVDYDKYLMEAATCTSLAKLYKSCTMCGASCEDPTNYFEDGELSDDHVHGSLCYFDDEIKADQHYYPATCGVDHPAKWEDHAYEEKIDADYLVSAANCSTPATYYKSCKCGKAGTETFTVGKETDHTYDKTKWVTDENEHWHATTAPCPHTNERTDVYAHTPSDWIVDEPARLGVKGTKYIECTICERVLETGEIPALGAGTSAKLAYKVTVENTDGGEVTSDHKYAYKGDEVTITVASDDDFDLSKLVVAGRDGEAITLTDNGDGTYTFTMPGYGVTVTPTFKDPNADKKLTTLVLTIDETEYVLNGETLNNDVAPVIKNDRTMLPIRLVAETFGADVTWNETEKFVTIVKGDTVIVVYIDVEYALVNGAPVELDAAAFIENDRTYLPVRFVSECLGATVEWNSETLEVTISLAE